MSNKREARSASGPRSPEPASNPRSWGLVATDFPQVKYWNKQAWKLYESECKNSTDLQTASGKRGATRSAQGINVMMLYIENSDGTLVSGVVAAQIREHARSIWRGFHSALKSVPERWGDASMDMRAEFFFDMESQFYPLRLCDNHWKAQAIATAIYPNWYKTFIKKRVTVKAEADLDEEPAAKRLKFETRDSTEAPEAGPVSSSQDGAMCISKTSKTIRPIDPL